MELRGVRLGHATGTDERAAAGMWASVPLPARR